MFIARTVAEAEAPILWPPDMKSRLIGKDSDAGKDRGHEKKRETEVRCLDGIINSVDTSLSKPMEDIDGQRSLACFSYGVTERVRHELTEQQQ